MNLWVSFCSSRCVRLHPSRSQAGLLIVLMTVVALVWANSPWGDSYDRLWHTRLSIGVLDHIFNKPLHFWINEGLMTVFFFVVGLEIKREVLIGDLGSFRKASLPVAAALGGMVVPGIDLLCLQSLRNCRSWLGHSHGHRYCLHHWRSHDSGASGSSIPDHICGCLGHSRTTLEQ